MPDIGIGALGYFGIAPETVEGTRVAPTKFLAVRSMNFNDSNDYLSPLQIRDARDITIAMPAPFIVSGSIEMDLVPHDIGNLLKSAFSAAVVTSAYTGGGYSHVFTPGDTSNYFSAETNAGDALVMSYQGTRVNTMQIKSSFGETVMATFGLDGISRSKITAPGSTPSYHATSLTPFHFTGASVTIGGSLNALVKDFTFGINNNVEHIGTLRTTRSYRRVALGAREVTLDMSMDFEDTAEYDRLLDDTEFAVILTLYGPTGVGAGSTSNMSLILNLPRVKYKTVGVPVTAGDFITQDVSCTVLKPNAAAIMTATLVNSETSVQLIA